MLLNSKDVKKEGNMLFFSKLVVKLGYKSDGGIKVLLIVKINNLNMVVSYILKSSNVQSLV